MSAPSPELQCRTSLRQLGKRRLLWRDPGPAYRLSRPTLFHGALSMCWAVNTWKSAPAGENAEMMAVMKQEAGQVERGETNPSCLAKDKTYQGNNFCLNLSQIFHDISCQIIRNFIRMRKQESPLGRYHLFNITVNQGLGAGRVPPSRSLAILNPPAVRGSAESSIGLYSWTSPE